ncbi:methyltransferase [Oceanithermus sp.]|uniref:class I SAM-dependent methyltransferase n=1 Tax=Oceanithermus sp. TaxID=2268145 RepID=UPI00257DED2E|nr:methyltransferase [Oceanithermus sp.]
MELAEYHTLTTLPTPAGPLWIKRGAPGLEDPAYRALAEAVEPRGARAIDLNPGVGVALLPLLAAGLEVDSWEDRRSALRALEASAAEHPGLRVRAALPWQVPEAAYGTALLVFGADRGNAWVRAQLLAAARALEPGGLLWVAGDKKLGFERYLGWARELVGDGEVVARAKGVRVAVLERSSRPAPEAPAEPAPLEAELRGRRLTFWVWPGVFSADAVDPASRLLLEHLPEDVGGAEVLDLGAGYGALSLPLAREGARVTLLEHQLASVWSARRSLQAAGLSAAVHHSDVDEALQENEVYDIVVSNPPFHVGGRVVLDVAEAFVAAAHRRTRPGGRFYLVANPFLKYEVWMHDRFGNVRTLHAGRYKVLLAVKQP